jgi:adenylate kinase
MGMMIELIVEEDELMARLLNRAIEQGRSDDNEETIKNRFNVYKTQTSPLIEWFEKEGIRNSFTYKGSMEQMLSEIYAAVEKKLN